MKYEKMRNFAFIAAIAMLLAGSAAAAITTSENAFAYNRNQAASQANDCGNGLLPTNVGCQNTTCQIQGDENSCALASQQRFGEQVTPPPPPPEEACEKEFPEAGFTWNVKMNEALDEFASVGDELCLSKLGSQEAGNLDTGDTATVVVTPAGGPNQDDCSRGQSGFVSSTVASGTPPNPLDFGDTACVRLQ